MIIANGKKYPSNCQDEILSEAESRITETLTRKTLPVDAVVNAIDRLGREIAAGRFDEQISALPVDDPRRIKALAGEMLCRDFLEHKLKVELGGYPEDVVLNAGGIRSRIMPLGVILHIAAGNMDGLPAFSLAEGLLTGNVNILKLPQADNGLSAEIIGTLIEYEPRLADFVYVFDTPSSDVHGMIRMASLADGIAVWGGEAAVSAVRRLAPVGAKLIEWGHKLSFAYVSGDSDGELSGLAEHIASTKQLLCSSCQVIFIDTDSEDDLHAFCRRFLPLLECEVSKRAPSSIGERARSSLIRYTDRLERLLGSEPPHGEYRGVGCSLTVCGDSELELSPMMCSVLVKKLPRGEIISMLRRKRGYLQTAGLICPENERAELTELLMRGGVTRITTAAAMSEYFAGEAHDGEYPLRRYTRIVNIE